MFIQSMEINLGEIEKLRDQFLQSNIIEDHKTSNFTIFYENFCRFTSVSARADAIKESK